jgi:hypothetical protein
MEWVFIVLKEVAIVQNYVIQDYVAIIERRFFFLVNIPNPNMYRVTKKHGKNME